jgi:hypothetical protein
MKKVKIVFELTKEEPGNDQRHNNIEALGGKECDHRLPASRVE